MSVNLKTCCCNPSPDDCVAVWRWKNSTCPDSPAQTEIFATDPQWKWMIQDCDVGGSQFIIFDYSGEPTYQINTVADGSGTDLGKLFAFNGGHTSFGTPPTTEPPIGELGCGQLDFIGYICDKSAQRFCNPSGGDGSDCICTREALALSDCDSLSSNSEYDVSEWKIIGYGTEPAGFDRSGYTPTTSAAGKKIWLGRGWYNNIGWDLDPGFVSFPKSLCVAGDCCDDECLSSTPTCEEWLAANPPQIGFVLGTLPVNWTACFPDPNQCSVSLQWDLEITGFRYTLAGHLLTGVEMDIDVTVTGAGWASYLSCQSQGDFPGPVSKSITLSDPNLATDPWDFCDNTVARYPVNIGYSSSSGSPWAEWCCFDFGGIPVCQQRLYPLFGVYPYVASSTSPVWPPPYGTTSYYPVQWLHSTLDPLHSIDPDCNYLGFPQDYCNRWDSGDEDGLFGYITITMPPAPPEC